MKGYKRLTNQEWSKDIDLTQELGYSYIYKRLHELEDKIENGTLVFIDEEPFYLEEYEMLANQYKALEIKYSNLSDNYRLCKDANETLKQNVITTRKETAEEILNRINEYNLNYNWDLKEEFIKLCKDYDVEVEE